jgi:hypothetical protein
MRVPTCFPACALFDKPNKLTACAKHPRRRASFHPTPKASATSTSPGLKSCSRPRDRNSLAGNRFARRHQTQLDASPKHALRCPNWPPPASGANELSSSEDSPLAPLPQDVAESLFAPTRTARAERVLSPSPSIRSTTWRSDPIPPMNTRQYQTLPASTSRALAVHQFVRGGTIHRAHSAR